MADPKEQQPVDLDEVLSELSNKIDRVKTLYEQYFMGIEKIEPLTARKEVQRVMLALQQQYIRNTGLRFRFNTMLQKWQIYVTYWNRILREIENGTYVRHVARAARAAAREGKELPDELLRAARRAALATDEPAPQPSPPQPSPPTPAAPPPLPSQMTPGAVPARGFLDMDSSENVLAALGGMQKSSKDDSTDPGLERVTPQPPKRSAPPPLPPPLQPGARPPPPPQAARAPSVPGMSETDLRALHQKYVDARKQTGEAAQVSYETLVSSLAKQVGQVLAMPGVKSVRFDVAVQNGRTVLKAIPQKK